MHMSAHRLCVPWPWGHRSFGGRGRAVVWGDGRSAGGSVVVGRAGSGLAVRPLVVRWSSDVLWPVCRPVRWGFGGRRARC